MFTEKTEQKLAIYAATSILATILIVTTFMSIEPVNTPKALILFPIGIASWFAILRIPNLKAGIRNPLLMLLVIFSLLSILNLLLSSAPAVQTLYGTFGRSTGALTYISLAGLLGLFAYFKNPKSYRYLIFAILTSGLINVIYCGIDIIGPDILGWNNQYGEILGTLGNPNFIGAFLGLTASIVWAYSFNSSTKKIYRFCGLITNFIILIEIYFSKAYQGLIVFILGFSLSLFFWIRDKNNTKLLISYIAFFGFSAFTGLLGVFQKGPLAEILYKSSVSFRGAYWNAGINMGINHPLTGVGFDSYGDYYREFRSAKAMISPGPTVVTNTAHNVPIDIFAAGGFPLLLVYLAIMGFGLAAIVKIVRNSKSYDVLATTLAIVWLGYQLQSLISINQIGLGIIGWSVTGALIGYSFQIRMDSNPKTIKTVETKFSPIVGALIGIAIGIPPFAADASWRSALHRGDGNAIIKSAYQWPKNTYKLTNIAFALEKSNLGDDALLIARENVKFNPRSYDAWKLLVQLSKSTPEEKNLGVEMLHKLDPLNTELK